MQKQQAICLINKVTRNFCKYCRYLRCQNLAGMSQAWVVSAHMPKVEKNPKCTKHEGRKEIKKENDEKRMNKSVNTDELSTPQKLLQHMKQYIDDTKHSWCSPDSKVRKEIFEII